MTSEQFDPFNLIGKKAAEGEGQQQGENSQGKVDFPRDESFDPFRIGYLQNGSSNPSAEVLQRDEDVDPGPEPPPQVTRVTRSLDRIASQKGSGVSGIPPKLLVKLSLHEEVSSRAKEGHERHGTSIVSVDGTVYAQVQCSDAKQNAPFNLELREPINGLQVRPNSEFSAVSGTSELNQHLVTIPKSEIGYVAVAHYTLSNEVEHMPILVERKVTTHKDTCRISIQVRSKLSNEANLEDFSIAVAVPDVVDAQSVEILRGAGQWDELKRLIVWKLTSLNKGESFMVSAQGTLRPNASTTGETRFPVLLRCSYAADQISAVRFEVKEAEGHPTSLTFHEAHSFRILHRLA